MLLYFVYKYAFGADPKRLADDTEIPNEEKYKDHVEGASATEALAKCKVPILFIHGEADELVPCEMSRTNYEACASEKELYTVAGAGHGLSYLANVDAYMGKFRGFLEKNFGRKRYV